MSSFVVERERQTARSCDKPKSATQQPLRVHYYYYFIVNPRQGGCHCAIPDTNDAPKNPFPPSPEHSLANVSSLLTVQSPKTTRSRSSHGLLVRATFRFCCFFSSAVFCVESVVTPTRARARDPLISRGARNAKRLCQAGTTTALVPGDK